MRHLVLIGAVLLAFGPAAQGQAYRCETDDGHTIFSDEPCGENAEAIELEEAPTSSNKQPSSARGSDETATKRNQDTDQNRPSRREDAEKKEDPGETASGPSDNPCLKPGTDSEILAPGTTESRIRSACGEPDRVSRSDNPAYDKALHYGDGERKIQIFINDGAKVGHNAL